MSQQTASLGIMTSDTFANRTKAPRSIGFFASKLKSRGSGMNGIDAALLSWELNCNSATYTPLQKFRMVERIQWECNQWLWKRRAKRSVLSNLRRQVVQELLQSLRAPLQFLEKKLQATGNPNPNAQPLVGIYQYERQDYVQTGKQGTALRASTVHGQAANIHSYNDYVQAFVNVDPADPDRNVRYLNRLERMQYMVCIDDGLFYKADGSILDCPAIGYCIYSWPYVVDKYGNMFSLDDVAFGQQVSDARLNHSTFCAGKEVICAGTAAWMDGTLIYLSNLSGHYQPNRTRLHEVAVMLAEEDIDTSRAVIQVRTAANNLDSYKFNTFAANPTAAADWTSFRQGNPGQFGVGLPEIKGFVVNNPA